ncbi:MAG: NAD-dependent DNA ligase LigA [Candidatus Saccharimonadales bacterium]
MNKSKARERILKLRELINDYRYHYHVLNESIMSEAAADSLKHELTQLESQYPELITPDSPSQRVAGEPLPGFKSVAHSQRMLSLNDVFDEEEILAWEERIAKLLPEGAKKEYFVDIKMDGLACALVYQDGILTLGITRGDGFTGEDVTANIRTIESIPLSLRHSKKYLSMLRGRTEVRGEIVMYKADFDALNEQRKKDDLPLFMNPRNTAAGTIRQLDPSLVSARKLHFRAYDLIRENAREIPSFEFAYQALHSLGFLTNTKAKCLPSVKAVMDEAHYWEEERLKLPYNTDGLVIKINDRDLFERLGVVGKAPRGAVALKYQAEQATTKVKNILISIGRTGAATPVALLEPVVIAGSTVQMATLHNEGEVLRKDIRIGDTVIVHKAGDIIPEVVEPLLSLRDGSEKAFKMPEVCPDCGTKLIKLKAEDAVWRCPNNACPSRSWKRIEHFASKSALDIEGLGEKNVISLMQAGLVNDIADIFSLKPEQLTPLERFADISAQKLVSAIQAKKSAPLNRFLYGLGIRHVGIQTATDIANTFRTFEAIASATEEELEAVEGVGTIVSESIVEWFSEDENKALIEKLKRNSIWPKPVEHIGGTLDDKRFAVTGSLESMGREAAAEEIRKRGGIFQSSVGKDTDYLVVGANVGASKLVKADKFGTKQISEKEFLALLD